MAKQQRHKQRNEEHQQKQQMGQDTKLWRRTQHGILKMAERVGGKRERKQRMVSREGLSSTVSDFYNSDRIECEHQDEHK